MLGERTMSKQEKCHLILGSPIVHSTHKMINVDLDNNSSILNFPSENTETSSSLVRKDSLIDAYATSFSATKWFDTIHFQFALNHNKLESMSLRYFCLNYYVGSRGSRRNKIIKGDGKIVVSFYPTPSCHPGTTSYFRYCKYSLLKYKPWKENPSTVYGGIDAEAETIIELWNNFTSQLEEDDIPDYLQREIEAAHPNQNDQNNPVYRANGNEYISPDAVPRADEDLLTIDNTSMVELFRYRQNDDIDSMDIDWDESHDWINTSMFSANHVETMNTRYHELRGFVIRRQ